MQPSFLTFDFEWRPLQNYLAEMGVAPPALLPAATPGDQPPSQALYDWVVRNHGAVVDGLRLGGYYHVSDYGMAGLALMSAETLGDALKVVRAYMLLFNPDIADIRVEHSTPGEIRIAISLNAPPGWSGQARQFHANVLASAAHNLFNELMGRRLSGMGLTLPAGLGDTRAYASHFHMPVRSCGSDIVFHLPAAALGWGFPPPTRRSSRRPFPWPARASTSCSKAKWAACASAWRPCSRRCRSATRTSARSPGTSGSPSARCAAGSPRKAAATGRY